MIIIQVSVVIPLYNKEAYIKRALESILDQSAQDFEIIVVDDGSTDEGVRVIKEFRDSRIVIVQQKNLGVSAARNRGILESKYELIAFLDADDEWMPNFLETILKLRVDYPHAGLYATNYHIVGNEGKTNTICDSLMPSTPINELLHNYFQIVKYGCHIFCSSSVAVPKQVFSQVGVFNDKVWWGEDDDIWGRIALKYPLAFSRKPCAFYYRDIVDSALHKKIPIKWHPFIQSAYTAIKNKEVSLSVEDDLKEYIEYLSYISAIRNIYSGDMDYALKLLIALDTKLYYRKKVLRQILKNYIRRSSSKLK